VSNGYLYANNTGNGSSIPPNLDVWQITPGCTLTFATSLANTTGINNGVIDGMAVTPNGKYLVVAYGDGSVGDYAIGSGSISLIGQEMIAGHGVGQGAYAGSVAISSNGLWAIFGDFSPFNTTQFDVAAIGSNGQLAPTTTYGGTGSLGPGLDSNGITLSPNNQFIYVVDTGTGQETTVSFDATTGVITYPNNCLTDLKGYNSEWSYASQSAVVANSGSGGGIYVSEGFLNGSQNSYIALLAVNSKTGCVTEAPHSPFADPNGNDLQSITSYTR
jgi:DNA-binding beta-propeller fold protein YncE